MYLNLVLCRVVAYNSNCASASVNQMAGRSIHKDGRRTATLYRVCQLAPSCYAVYVSGKVSAIVSVVGVHQYVGNCRAVMEHLQ